MPKPLPVILYLARPGREQSETLKWVKEWVAQHGGPGVAKLEEILRDAHPRDDLDWRLEDIVFSWRLAHEPEKL